jgi:hypothetical protein
MNNLFYIGWFLVGANTKTEASMGLHKGKSPQGFQNLWVFLALKNARPVKFCVGGISPASQADRQFLKLWLLSFLSLLFLFRFTIWLKPQLFYFLSSIRTFQLFLIGLWIGASPETTRLLTDASLHWLPSLLQGKLHNNESKAGNIQKDKSNIQKYSHNIHRWWIL